MGGEAHVTIKMALPYSEWGISDAAASAGLVQVDTLPFDFSSFPGYEHQTTEADAVQLDVSSNRARKLLKTLVFKRRKQAA